MEVGKGLSIIKYDITVTDLTPSSLADSLLLFLPSSASAACAAAISAALASVLLISFFDQLLHLLSSSSPSIPPFFTYILGNLGTGLLLTTTLQLENKSAGHM